MPMARNADQQLCWKQPVAMLNVSTEAPSLMVGNSNKQDIRKQLPSPGANSSGHTTPSRRRRVMSTSDSEEERNSHARQTGTQQPRHQSWSEHERAHPTEAANNAEVVVLESSDDMPELYHRALPFEDKGYQGQHRPSAIDQQNLHRCIEGSNRQSQHQSSQVRNEQRSRPHKRRSRRLDSEVSESSALTDSDSTCYETDTNARSQYRDAILGVRNANQARQQVRARTQVCPTCARFASFLANFM